MRPMTWGTILDSCARASSVRRLVRLDCTSSSWSSSSIDAGEEEGGGNRGIVNGILMPRKKGDSDGKERGDLEHDSIGGPRFEVLGIHVLVLKVYSGIVA